MRDRSRHSAGFTLLELLLAIAIAVTAASVMILLFGSVSRFVAGENSRAGTRAAAERALQAIRNDAACALLQEEDLACLLSLAQGPEGPVLSLCATRRAPDDEGAEWAETVSVQYRAAPGAGTDIDFLQIERPLTGVGSLAGPVTNLLVRNVASLRMEIFDGSAWRPAWPPEEGKQRPRLLRIAIGSGGGPAVESIEAEFGFSSGIVATSSVVRGATTAPAVDAPSGEPVAADSSVEAVAVPAP